MELVIRRALPQDAYEYAACHLACWRSAYRGIIPDDYLDSLSAEKWAERFRRNLKELPEHRYCCAVLGESIIGILIVGKSRDEDKPGAGEVCALYLAEEYWGRGFGRRMMDYATRSLREMGCGEAVLWVLEENRRARRFYERYGFAADGPGKQIVIGKPLAEVRYALGL